MISYEGLNVMLAKKRESLKLSSLENLGFLPALSPKSQREKSLEISPLKKSLSISIVMQSF